MFFSSSEVYVQQGLDRYGCLFMAISAGDSILYLLFLLVLSRPHDGFSRCHYQDTWISREVGGRRKTLRVVLVVVSPFRREEAEVYEAGLSSCATYACASVELSTHIGRYVITVRASPNMSFIGFFPSTFLATYTYLPNYIALYIYLDRLILWT